MKRTKMTRRLLRLSNHVGLAILASLFFLLTWSSRYLGPFDSIFHYPRLLRGHACRWTGTAQLHQKEWKTILFWNSQFDYPDYGFGTGRQPFLESGCPENRCFTSSDRYLLPIEKWDAVIFHAWNLQPEFVPWRRSPKQRYVMFMMEAPPMAPATLRPFANFFNWTMTYRYDSDIPRPYGWVAKKPVHLPSDALRLETKWSPEHGVYKGPDLAARKTNFAAWFVSKCTTPSYREDLARELAKYVPIEVYGKCGNLTCPVADNEDCLGMVSKKYKFYLAFENSECRDYVTEKFFNVLRLDVVPVVFGGADYSRIAPPGSYVNANLFPNASALAKHLLNLHRNNTLYNQHFWWKQYYDVAGTSGRNRNLQHQGFCQLCRMLHQQDSRSDIPHSSYGDIQSWWDSRGTCKPGWGRVSETYRKWQRGWFHYLQDLFT